MCSGVYPSLSCRFPSAPASSISCTQSCKRQADMWRGTSVFKKKAFGDPKLRYDLWLSKACGSIQPSSRPGSWRVNSCSEEQRHHSVLYKACAQASAPACLGLQQNAVRSGRGHSLLVTAPVRADRERKHTCIPPKKILRNQSLKHAEVSSARDAYLCSAHRLLHATYACALTTTRAARRCAPTMLSIHTAAQCVLQYLLQVHVTMCTHK